MRDITLEDTIYMDFTTRSFSTGVPTQLAGTPALSVLEENNATPITSGVSVAVDRASVTGLNMATVVATAANGYEAGKGYSVYISTGTVGGVSVVGEKVGEFTIQANPVNWGKVTAPTTAVDLSGTDIQLVDTTTTNTDMLTAAAVNAECDTAITDAALATAASLATAQADLDTITGADGVNLLSATQASIDAIETDTGTTLDDHLTDIKGTGFVKDTHSLIDIETYVDILDDGTSGNAKIATDVAAVLVDTADMQPKLGTPAADVSADIAAVKVDTAATLVDTAEIGAAGAGLTDLGGMSTAMKAEVNAEADTALTDYDGPTNAEMEARTPTAAELAYIVANAATGLPVTFTTAGGSTTAAVLNLVDGSAGSATDDQYNGRLLVFTDGTLAGVVTDITDYTGSTTTATITAIPTAPTSSHNARLI